MMSRASIGESCRRSARLGEPRPGEHAEALDLAVEIFEPAGRGEVFAQAIGDLHRHTLDVAERSNPAATNLS
jgi:hypothetical protein